MQNMAANNIISFVASHAVVDIHYHKCFQIVISLGAPFDCTIDKQKHPALRGFLINQSITHSCAAQDTSVLVYFIDAESILGWQLREMLDGKPFVPIDALLTREELAEMIRQYGEARSVEELRHLANGLLEKILPSRKEARQGMTDNRMNEIIAYIDGHLDNPLALQDLANHIFLSPERIRHLFAQETGIPFSQYVLWKRMKLVLTEVLQQKMPIVNSAIQNGFTDQAHFARLFKRTFGVSAGLLLKNSRSVQFLAPVL
jgi:AraC-like DNA-binding protein